LQHRTLLATGLALAAVGVPLALAALDSPLLSHSYGRSSAPFEAFAALAAAAVAALAARDYRSLRARSGRELVPIAAPVAVALVCAAQLGEHPRKPYDYDCYEYAGRALLLGENPYRVGLTYLYPPLTAQLLALAQRAGAALASAFGAAPDADAIWSRIFYLYQCAQFGLVLALHALGVRLVQRFGAERAAAHALVALLLIVDNPLLRTLRHGQLNLFVLDAALLALLAAARRPALAGAALAFAIHAKLYPIVLLLPLAAARQRRAVAWCAAFGAAVALLQTDFGRDATLWWQFADFYRSHYPGEIAYRNNSAHSLVWNTLRLGFGAQPSELRGPVAAISSATSLAVLGWLALRVRARLRRTPGQPPASEAAALFAGADALALSLFVSQSVWEHHFVFALPLYAIAVVERGRRAPGVIALAGLLIFGLPTADLFPFTYHRAAGLGLLLWQTRPARSATRVA
jgi:hypothetical protein